jgi:hypothetical protein
MSESKDALHGLGCPRCGGMVPIPEGQAVVICPFCDLRSVVSGENGIYHYQVPCKVERESAVVAYQKFLKGSMAIAGDTSKKSQLTEVVLVHLPFWSAWGRGLGWTFGIERIREKDTTRKKPREVRVAKELNWTGAACDVGEFGVNRVELTGRPLEPLKVEALHRTGMVFEPVGSSEEALATALKLFEDQVRSESRLDEITQSFVRITRPFLGLVYYPLWVMRYIYKGRSFQVVVDGFSGEVLYGKAPGNVFYRAGVLVGGMALGSFLAVDVNALILSGSNSSDDNPLAIVVVCFLAGIGLMYVAFRKFRYGEHYEYNRYSKIGINLSTWMPKDAEGVMNIVGMLGGSR